MYIFVRIFIPHPSCLGTKNRSESLCLYIHYFNPDNMASMLKNNRPSEGIELQGLPTITFISPERNAQGYHLNCFFNIEFQLFHIFK